VKSVGEKETERRRQTGPRKRERERERERDGDEATVREDLSASGKVGAAEDKNLHKPPIKSRVVY